MMTVKARYDGKVFVPEGPVDLPVGTEVELTLGAPPGTDSAESAWLRLAQIADQFPSNPDWPADLATEHDHYLYGTPKRSEHGTH